MRIVLIGHTVGIKFCIETINSNGDDVVVAVVTHKFDLHKYDLELFSYREEVFGDFAYNVFDVPNDYGISLYEYADINSEETITAIRETYNPDMIVTVGCRDILSEKFINSFQYVINLHPFNIPEFRGAGIDSWMILQGYSGTTQFATAHFINKKIDSGNIICREPYQIPEKATPIEIFKVRMSKLGGLLTNALLKVRDEHEFTGGVQSHEDSVYYPRLYTPRDGRINFEWNGKAIELFVRAFSYPYPGAFFLIEERTIHCLSCTFHPRENVHPFAYGLLFRKTENSIFIFVKDGYVELSDFESDKEQFHSKKLKIGIFIK